MPRGPALSGLREEISFEGVSFEYRPGEPVLRNISFRVPRGSVVALVGPSGAGKTTLLDLLARFYEVTDGRITMDGTDIRAFSLLGLRSSLGIVSQETILFHDTVRANIAYGRPGAAQEGIERAARAAYAHDFIQHLPKGYDTVVGERGTELSGGQRQRLAIARAILRDPPILVFDEATSALDTESERVVQQAIERLLEGRTVFVIAHRLSTVQRADQILVLEDGGIVERGTHQDPLGRGGPLPASLRAPVPGRGGRGGGRRPPARLPLGRISAGRLNHSPFHGEAPACDAPPFGTGSSTWAIAWPRGCSASSPRPWRSDSGKGAGWVAGVVFRIRWRTVPGPPPPGVSGAKRGVAETRGSTVLPAHRAGGRGHVSPGAPGHSRNHGSGPRWRASRRWRRRQRRVEGPSSLRGTSETGK